MSLSVSRARYSLLLIALSVAGCANYSGLTTQGKSLDANTLQAEHSLQGISLSPAAWPKRDW